MQGAEISVSDRPAGFGDYIAATHFGTGGHPVELPSSGLLNVLNVLDEWINSNGLK